MKYEKCEITVKVNFKVRKVQLDICDLFGVNISETVHEGRYYTFLVCMSLFHARSKYIYLKNVISVIYQIQRKYM